MACLLLLLLFCFSLMGSPSFGCVPIYNRGGPSFPKLCPKDSPSLEAGLCWKRCRKGYQGIGPTCVQKCSSFGRTYDDFVVTCNQKLITRPRKSYVRELIGLAPNVCPSDKPVKILGICYPRCKRGYSQGIGAACTADCRSGYKEVGPVCFKNVFRTYSRGAAYSRSGNKPRGCPSHKPEKWKGACYPRCRSGYVADGIACRKICPKGSKTETFLCTIQELKIKTKKVYGRPVGKTPRCGGNKVQEAAGLCWNKCNDPKDDGIGPWCTDHSFKQGMKKYATVGEDMTKCLETVGLATLIKATKPEEFSGGDKSIMDIFGKKRLKQFGDCLDPLVKTASEFLKTAFREGLTLGIEVGINGNAGIGGGLFAGVALHKGWSKNAKWEFKLYGGSCVHFTNDIGASLDLNVVIYRSLGDIEGDASSFSMSKSVGKTDLSIGASLTLDKKCEIIGISGDISFGKSLKRFAVSKVGKAQPAGFAMGTCHADFWL